MNDFNEQGKWRDIPDDVTIEQINSILKEDGTGQAILDKSGLDMNLEDCRFMVEHLENADAGEDVQIVLETKGQEPDSPPWESKGAITVYETERVGQYGLVVGNDISLPQYDTLRKIAAKVGPKEIVE